MERYIGPATLRVVRALDPALLGAAGLREFLLEQKSPEELLRDKRFWVLLVDSQPQERVNALGYELGLDSVQLADDAYSELRTLSRSRRGDLLEAFGIENDGKFVSEPPEQKPAVEVSGCGYSLFPHQRAALKRLRPFLSGGNDSCRVVLHMPTGSGKTRTTMRLISEHLLHRENETVLWVANSQELCEQALQEFLKAWSSVGNRNLPAVRLWGGRRVDSYPAEGLIVASAQTLHAIRSDSREGTKRTRLLAANLGMLVFDEAHQVIADTYSLAVDFITEMHNNLPVIGLTATPGRTWADLKEDERLAAFFQGNKVRLEVSGYASPVRYLIDEGYLAEPKFVYRKHDWAPGSELARKLESQLDASSEVLNEIGSDVTRNLLVRDSLLSICRSHRRVLYFAPSVENSEAMAFLLAREGVPAVSVTSKTGPGLRASAICEFLGDGSEPMVLCNFGVLTTGFDAPQTSAAVIARPTKSLVLYSQMVGRAMRGRKAGGNSHCEIHTIVDSGLPGFDHPIAAFDNWEDVWSKEEIQ